MAREYKNKLNIQRGLRHCTRFPALSPWPILLMAIMISLFSFASVFAKGGEQVTQVTSVADTRAGKQIPTAMAVYSSGSVMVVGSTNTGGSDDYHAVKFNPDILGKTWTPNKYAAYGVAGNDVITAVVVDSAKNTIVTGYTTGSTIDIHTIKYCGATGSPSCGGKLEGEVIWEHTYNNGGSDYATAIAVDASDNIYVAGYAANGTRNDDYLIIKYAPGGPTPNPEWVELWDNDASDIPNNYPNYHNRITAITAGVDGIAVTGYSSKNGGLDFDIITIKYGFDKTLVRKWRYASPGAKDDRGVAVKMDSSGNVIMTGYITNALSKTNIYTAKYNPGADTPAWEKNSYVGVANDMPTGLWVDSAGDVYITGSTYTLAGGNDFYTARFSSTGTTVWEAIFDTGNGANDIPVGIVVDDAADGGVFVAGSTSNALNNDFLTLKYKKDSAVNGVLLWKNIWNGPSNKNDQPIGIALEPGGGPTPRNVIVAGYTEVATGTDYDFAVIKYDYGALNAPTNLNAQTASDTSITLTWDDNATNEDKFVIQRKLGESGAWGDIVTNPVTLGPGTLTYTDGIPPTTPLVTNNYYYYRVRAYNAANLDSGYSNEARALTKAISYLAPTWSYSYAGAFGGDDYATGITIDTTGTATTAGSPVVTGSSEIQESAEVYSDDFLTFKLDRSDTASTSMKWKAIYDSSTGDGMADNAAGVALDSLGNVLVTGTVYTSLNSDDIYTRKVATAGLTDPGVTPALLADHQYAGTRIDTATTIAMAKDGSNNSVVIGYGKNALNNDSIYIIKYNPDSTRPAWSPIIYSSGTTRSFRSTGVAFDAALNIFVTGYSFVTASPAGSQDWFTAKYNGATGALIWSDSYDISNVVYGVSNGDDKALSIDVDASGNAYVTGTAKNSDGNSVIYTVKYKGAPAGAPVAERMWAGAGVAFNNPGYDARPVAVRVDPVDGGVVVGGTAYNSTDSDFVLIRYNPADGTAPDGKVLVDGIRKFWHEDFNLPVNYDYATAMTMDASGYIYLTGNSRLGPDTDPASDFTSDILSVIYDYEGTYLGAMRYPLTHDNRQDEAKAIAANHRGEAFIAGFSRNAADNKDYAVLKQTHSYLRVPGLFTAIPAADYNKMDLTWAGQSSSDNYHVYRRLGSSNNPDDWTLIKTTADFSQAYQDTGPLLPGTNYCYTVDSFNGSLNSRKTPTCATTRLQAPTWTATPLTVDSISQITLGWNPVADSTGYKIERKTGSGGTWGVVVANTTTNPYPDSGLLSGTQYYYRISSNNGSGSSLTSTEQNAITKPAVPTLSAIIDISNKQMYLQWGAITGAASYTLEYKDGVGGTYIASGCPVNTNLNCRVNLPVPVPATPDKVYYFRVKATNATSLDSAWSTEVNATATLAAPTWDASTPTLISNNSMTLTWVYTAATGATPITYVLQYRTVPGSYADEITPSACSGNATLLCSVTGLTPGTNYAFRVKATNSNGSSAWTAEKTAIPVMAAPTLNVPTGVVYNGMTLPWTAVTGAASYLLQYKVSGGSYPADVNTASACGVNTSTSCAVSGLSPNTSYVFRVKAVNASGVSLWSGEQTKLTPLETPGLTSATATVGDPTKIDLLWTGSTGATGYSIEQSDCKNSDSNPASCDGTTEANYNTWAVKTTVGAVTTASITGLTGGTDYRYRITATGTAPVNTSAVSVMRRAWTNITPPTLAITPNNTTSLILTWDQKPGETNYAIERGPTTSGPWTTLVAAHPINNITYTDNGLSGADDFCYQIKAYRGASFAYSTPKCKKLPPTAPVSASASIKLDSSYTVIEDAKKNWTMADYWNNQPVVITSGGNTYTRRIAGSVQTGLYASPALTTEAISAGDGYVVLQTVTGMATGNDGSVPTKSLSDGYKNWGNTMQWVGSKIKILNSANTANIGLERVIDYSGNTIYFQPSALPSPTLAGDTYRVASFFGAATAAGTTVQLTHTGSGWTANAWTGYYVMMTSGSNNGHARRINSNTTTILTTDAFPIAIASGDTYLIAPEARIGSYYGKAIAPASATIVTDSMSGWNWGNWAGYYLVMTSGNNKDKIRKIASNTVWPVTPATLTVSVPFDSTINANDTYLIASAAQIASYFGNAAGSGSTAAVLEDAANSWGTSDWTGYYLIMTSGSNDGQVRTISSNTATTLTVLPAFDNPINAGDSYLIASVNNTKGSGTISTAVAANPNPSYKGLSQLTLTNGAVEFSSTAPGFANNYNYGMLSLKDVSQLNGDFDTQFDYNVLSGLIPANATIPYLYLQSTYASSRFDFSSPSGKNYQTYIYRGRFVKQDNGRITDYSSALKTMSDTRTMPDSATAWKAWQTDTWKNFYVQMIGGPNNQLVRKITGNTANSLTLESEFPNDPSGVSGNAADGVNTNTKLVDRTGTTNWITNIWANYFLYMNDGPNAGKYMRIASNDATSVTVEGTGFPSPIGNNDSYKIFGDPYRINVIAGNAVTNGSAIHGLNNTASMLIDSSDTIGTTLRLKDWGTNQWQGFYLYMSSGPNIGLSRTIASNSDYSITVDTPFPYQIGSGDSYTIFDPGTTVQSQATEAYWIQIYNPIAGVQDYQIFPTSDASGKLRITKTGSTMKFYTSPAATSWTLRRQLELSATDAYAPIKHWIYQLGRVPHAGGTSQKTQINNFKLTTTALTSTIISPLYWLPEVGHNYQRPDLITYNQMQMSWNNISEATLYEVERCEASDHNLPTSHTTVGTCVNSYLPVEGSTGVIYTGSTSVGLTAGYTYRYRVRAWYNASTEFTAWSNEQWFTVVPPAPTMVAPAAGTATISQLTPTWNNVNGDNGYKLYWKTSSDSTCADGTWSVTPIAQAINIATYNHASLAHGTIYCYYITANGPPGPPATQDSVASNIVWQSTKPDPPTSITFSGITATKIDLAWSPAPSSGITYYWIERKTGAAGAWGTLVANAPKSPQSYSDTTVVAGTQYYYRITAKSNGGNSAASSEYATTTTPAATTSLTLAVISSDQINLSWPVMFGATRYKIERSEGAPGAWVEIDNQPFDYGLTYCGEPYPMAAPCNVQSNTVVSYADNTYSPRLKENTLYYYRVKSWNSTGGDSLPSAEKFATTSAMPKETLTATPLDGGFRIQLDWTDTVCTPACATPYKYELQRQVRDGIWVTLKSIDYSACTHPTCTYVDKLSINPGKQHRYRIRSLNEAGTDVSPYSNEASAFAKPYSAAPNVCTE